MNTENNPSFLNDIISSTLDTIEKGFKKSPIDNEDIRKRLLKDIDQLEELAKECTTKGATLTQFNNEIHAKISLATETDDLSIVENPFKSMLNDM